jgi:signal transduction histidine kinase
MLPVKDSQGRVLLWFGSNTDITEQKKVKTHLHQAKEAANRARSAFLASMSHEIRASMNGVGVRRIEIMSYSGSRLGCTQSGVSKPTEDVLDGDGS